MISYMKGILISKSPVSIILENNNIAYNIFIPMSTFDKLPKENSSIKIFIHFQMNDDGIKLFGFLSLEEKEIFKKIISISRIGPKIGLSVLSTFSIPQFIDLIMNKNSKILSKVPGLGKKSSERLILELKDKIAFSDYQKKEQKNSDLNYEDIENALIVLGYNSVDIMKCYNSLSDEDKNRKSTEALIKTIIKMLYKKG